MTDAANELERLAEADGAWWAKDKDGITIVRRALSRAEAARLYSPGRCRGPWQSR